MMDLPNAGYCIQHDRTISASQTVNSQWSELHKSAYVGDLENIKRLLRRKQDVNSADNNGLTALMLASSEGHFDLVYFLLNQGADVNAVTKDNADALMIATYKGHDDIAYVLIQCNANYKRNDSKGNSAFMMACERGSLKIVELLLGLNVDVNLKNKNGETALMIAASHEHEAIVDLLLKHKADCNIINDKNVTCLMIAAYKGQCRLVELLLEHKADFNCVNKYNYNALKYAAEKGHSQVVKLLLQYGAVDKYIDDTGLTALNLASFGGHLKTVELLLHNVTNYNLFISFSLAVLNKNVDVAQLLVNDKNNYLNKRCKGLTVDPVDNSVCKKGIFHACLVGNVELVEKYLECRAGVNINYRFREGSTALLIATKQGYTALVKFLLSHKADVNRVCDMGYSALMIAAQEGHLAIVELLLQHKADVSIVCTQFHYNALMIATEERHTDIVKLLLTTSVEIQVQNEFGFNVLMIAAYHGYNDIIKLLLKTNINLNNVDSLGDNALCIAAKQGHLEAVKLLLTTSIDINSCGKTGENAFTWAVRGGYEDIVDILLNKDVNSEYVTPNGFNGLMFASFFGHVKIVESLLQRNVNVNYTNKNGVNALMIAVVQSNFEIVQMLLNVGADFTAATKPARNLDSTTKTVVEFPDDLEIKFDVLVSAVNRGLLEMTDILLKHDINQVLIKRKGNFALRVAMLKEDIPMLKMLLMHGADCNQEFFNNIRPLHVAAELGLTTVVEVLLEFNAEVNTMDGNGNTGLLLACYGRHLETAKLLIRAKTNLHQRSSLGFTALHVAVAVGLTEIIEELILQKCDLEAEIILGFNVLYCACYLGKEEAAKILLDNNADCNKAVADGLSPLMVAATEGHNGIVKLLLKHEADIALVEHQGCTALMFAAKGGYTEIVETICKSAKCTPDVINYQNLSGFTALMLATQSGHIDCVRTLLNYSANCNMFNNYDSNALFLAINTGYEDIVKLLIENRANLNASDSRGCNALMQASLKKQLNIVTELLRHDVEINNVNKDDATALMFAAFSGSFEIVKLLVQHGADISYTNKQEQNVLTVAIMHRQTAIANFLIEQKATSERALYLAIALGQREVVNMLIKSEDKSDANCSHSLALLIAARVDNFEIVTDILKYGIENHSGENIEIPAIVLTVENDTLLKRHAHLVTKCDLQNRQDELNFAFYLAENFHILLTQWINYPNLFEFIGAQLWFYLYSALDSEKEFEEEIRNQIEIGLNYSTRMSAFECNPYNEIIDPRKLDFKQIERSVVCLRSLRLAKIQKKSKILLFGELISHAKSVMEEYAKMEHFEAFRFYVHHKCLHMIATLADIDSASQIVEVFISNKYAELTMKYLKDSYPTGLFTDTYLPPIVYNILKTIHYCISYSKSFAMILLENGIVDFLTKYLEYTRITNNQAKAPPTFVLLILHNCNVLAKIPGSKQLFQASGTVKVLRDFYEISILKVDIIMLISVIEDDATQLPNLNGQEIQHYVESSYEKFFGIFTVEWVKGLTLISEKYESSQMQISEHFAFFNKLLKKNVQGFKEPIISCLKKISTSKESSSLIATNNVLLKTLDDFRKTETKIANDAKDVLWNSCRESGIWPQLPTELFSTEFPRKFELTNQLSKGSFGSVFYVEDVENPQQKRFVAKQISHDRRMHKMETILLEAQILLKAKHERIVQFHGYQIKHHFVFIFMEYMQKGTLSRFIKVNNGLDEYKTRLFTAQILEGLDYLHQNNILHLDIKGTNILIENENSVKIADFGLSKIIKKEHDLSVINGGGTPGFTAPEVIAGHLNLDLYSRADIWSVGCTVVQMITQKRPDNSLQIQQLCFKMVTNQKPSYTLPANSSKELNEFLDKTFIIEPGKRPSAEQLLQTDCFILGTTLNSVH